MRVRADENYLAILGAPGREPQAHLDIITNLDGLDEETAQAAFDAQFGKGAFEVRDHGTILTVRSYALLRGWWQQRINDGKNVSDEVRERFQL